MSTRDARDEPDAGRAGPAARGGGRVLRDRDSDLERPRRGAPMSEHAPAAAAKARLRALRAAAPDRVPTRAWAMLALAVAAQTAGSFLVSTPVYLIPLLHLERGVSLAEAGFLAAAPTMGMVATLVAWGALADRTGERRVIAGGLALTAATALGAVLADGFGWLAAMLALCGAASASSNSASGRVVVGWFPARRRGFAMGIRQIAQPLGVAAAAVVVPPVAAGSGIGATFLLSVVVLGALAVACALVIRDPARTAPGRAKTSSGAEAGDAPDAARTSRAPRSPYRRSAFLVRVHVASVLLVVPQFALSTFGILWLIVELGWDETAAGVLVGSSQLVGALGRIAIGAVSDRSGSRTAVLRVVCVAGVVVMLLVAGAGALGWSVVGALVFVVATIVSVADNGLAFTSVAEAAGPAWAGRALGVQNTGQFLAASAVGPGVGAVVAVLGFPVSFALIALAPLAAWFVVPRGDEHAI